MGIEVYDRLEELPLFGEMLFLGLYFGQMLFLRCWQGLMVAIWPLFLIVLSAELQPNLTHDFNDQLVASQQTAAAQLDPHSSGKLKTESGKGLAP